MTVLNELNLNLKNNKIKKKMDEKIKEKLFYNDDYNCNNENNVKNKICSLIKIDFNCRHTA